MCRPASGAHHEPMINDITFATVKMHQQELLDDAANYRLAHRATPRRSTRLSIATRWNRLRHARTERPASGAHALEPVTSCSAR